MNRSPRKESAGRWPQARWCCCWPGRFSTCGATSDQERSAPLAADCYRGPAGPEAGFDGSVMGDWRDDIFAVLQDHDIRQVYHVPDAGHSRLIEACQKSNSIRTLALTTEEEGIAIAAGAWLGGQRSALLMQSSGVGNTINLMGLTKTLRFPFLTLITMRGEYGEFNSWQYPMGQGTPKVLEAMGVLLYSVDKADEVRATVDAAARSAFNGGQAVAVLLRQKLIGIKDFGKKKAKA